MTKKRFLSLILVATLVFASVLVLASCQKEDENKVTLESITISQEPNKLVYEVGDYFDASGLEITAKYSDDSTKVIKTGYTLSPNTSTALTGEETGITVTYEDKTAVQPISFKLLKATFKGFWVAGGDVPNTATFYSDGTLTVTPLIYEQTYNWHLNETTGLIECDYTPNENFKDVECKVVGNMVLFYCYSRLGLSHYLPIDEYNEAFGTNLQSKVHTAEEEKITLSVGENDDLVVYNDGLCEYKVGSETYTAIWANWTNFDVDTFGFGPTDHSFGDVEIGAENATIKLTAGGQEKTYSVDIATWNSVFGSTEL